MVLDAVFLLTLKREKCKVNACHKYLAVSLFDCLDADRKPTTINLSVYLPLPIHSSIHPFIHPSIRSSENVPTTTKSMKDTCHASICSCISVSLLEETVIIYTSTQPKCSQYMPQQSPNSPQHNNVTMTELFTYFASALKVCWSLRHLEQFFPFTI